MEYDEKELIVDIFISIFVKMKLSNSKVWFFTTSYIIRYLFSTFSGKNYSALIEHLQLFLSLISSHFSKRFLYLSKLSQLLHLIIISVFVIFFYLLLSCTDIVFSLYLSPCDHFSLISPINYLPLSYVGIFHRIKFDGSRILSNEFIWHFYFF